MKSRRDQHRACGRGQRDGRIGGLINYAPASSFAHGDNPAYAEYHWHGLQLAAGNLELLAGLGLFAVLLVAAARVARDQLA